MEKPKLKIIFRFLLLAIVSLRYIFDTQIAEYNSYATYLIEVIIVFMAAFSFSDFPAFKFKIKFLQSIWFVIALLMGFMVYKLAGFLQIIVPFDFTVKETVFFLLIIAPILEEFLFRFAYTVPFESAGLNWRIIAPVSALLFSLSHLNSIRYVPAEFFQFVFFQTAYTFFLGLGCYIGKHKFNKAISFSIILHFLFNLGFYLSSLSS